MNANQFRLMFIPLLATLILGGFVTTVGLLTEPASLKYGVELTDIASQFAWLWDIFLKLRQYYLLTFHHLFLLYKVLLHFLFLTTFRSSPSFYGVMLSRLG